MGFNSVNIEAQAGESLATAQGLAVYVDGSDEERVKIADSATAGLNETILGICVSTGVADDDWATICIEGFCDAKAGAAIEPFDYVAVEDSTGRVIPAPAAVDTSGGSADEGATDRTIGQYIPLPTINAAGAKVLPDAADGELCRIYLFGPKNHLVGLSS